MDQDDCLIQESVRRDAEDVAEHEFLLDHPEPSRTARGVRAWQRRHLPKEAAPWRPETVATHAKRRWWSKHKAGSRAAVGRRCQGRRARSPLARRSRASSARSSRASPEPPGPHRRQYELSRAGELAAEVAT